jgi:hypothetical protein
LISVGFVAPAALPPPSSTEIEHTSGLPASTFVHDWTASSASL